jgi:DNA helicase MCM8
MVSSNIMNLYRGRAAQALPPTGTTVSSLPTATSEGGENRLPLSERLAWVADFQKDALPADLVRDYIAYARQYCKPKLTAEAASVLKDYYMELRYPSGGRRRNRNDTVPITTRQLEALIRLCQARAKACLRDFCLKEDALDVVELMSRSVDQVHTDESGLLDAARGGAGGVSKRKVKKLFVQQLQQIVGVGAECAMDDLRKIADRVNCGLGDFEGVVEDLRNNGILLKKSTGLFQVMS